MSERDFRLYCADILDSGSAIREFVKGLSFEEFSNDRKTYSAVIREFEISVKRQASSLLRPADRGERTKNLSKLN